MGYVSKDIAIVTEPKIVSLSALPNFVVFESKPSSKQYLEIELQVYIKRPLDESKSFIRITDTTGATHIYKGTYTASEVKGPVFFIADDTSDTAENLRQVLLSDVWFNANFEAVLPFVWENGKPRNGSVLYIKSRGAGAEYNINLEAPKDTANKAFGIKWVNRTSINNDSIGGEASTTEINVDIYEGHNVFLGQDDRPINPQSLGKQVISLQKTYTGSPLWFELNAIFSNRTNYHKPPVKSGWFDPGTITPFRFVAKVKAVNSFSFYQSNALYVLDGFGPITEEIDLENYVYTDGDVRLLTNKPRTPYVRGQKEFLNFIFRDSQRGITPAIDYSLRVAYRSYSTGGEYLGTVYSHEIARNYLNMVNSCLLNIDAVLDKYPTTGILRIALARGASIVSTDLEYSILPGCLHSVRQFSFINRLGGWDSYNFDAPLKNDIKPKTETYIKTVTPFFQKGDSIETVYSNYLDSVFTIEGAPVTDEVAGWLSEMAAARVVLDGDGRYILLDDFTLSTSAGNKNMQRPTIKYRISDIV